MKVVSSRPAGYQQVYDIGVPKHHNFILENGLVSHNCFNKCLIGTELVKTTQGNKALDTLTPEDKIIVSTPEGTVIAPVVELVDSGIQETYLITFEDNTTVECTLDHKFLCADNKYHTAWNIFRLGLTMNRLL